MKRLLCLAVCCLLLACSVTAKGQTQSFAQILQVQVQQQGLCLTLQVGQGGEYTCLIYEANEQGEQGNLLQVSQFSLEGAGVHTQTFLVSSCQGYMVHLGGGDVGIPKKVTVYKTYQSSAWRIEGQETTLTLQQNATHLTDLQVVRGEQTVTPGDVVLPGDQIVGYWDETPYVGYAVVAGDVDGNGQVNAKDALRVLRYSVGKIQFTPTEFTAADFSQSQKVDAVTALNILKFSVGKLKSL